MSRPVVFVTRTIPQAGLALLSEQCDLRVWPEENAPGRGQFLNWARGVAGMVTMLNDRVDAGVMDAAGEGLKVISNYAVGFDNIDIAEATRRGVVVTNTPGVLTDATADLAFALMMALGRRVVEAADHVRAGRWKSWSPMLLLGHDIHGATLGIVGPGRIGAAMARRAAGFEMKVLYHGRSVSSDLSAMQGAWRCDDLHDMLSRCDFVSLHVPYTPATHHMIDARALAAMKASALLINTSRGAVVDTEALLAALRDGRIAGAALDVTDPEPLPPDHPLVRMPNCLVVPHIGSGSIATRSRMAVMAAENLLAVLRGERPDHPVNPEVT